MYIWTLQAYYKEQKLLLMAKVRTVEMVNPCPAEAASSSKWTEILSFLKFLPDIVTN